MPAPRGGSPAAHGRGAGPILAAGTATVAGDAARWVVAAALAAAMLLPEPAAAQLRVTQEEALGLAFPDAATIRRETAYLSDEQLAAARSLAGGEVEVETSVVTYYLARDSAGTPLGVAYFDAHRVRTHREVLMVVVSPEARVRHVEVLRFDEPREYLPPEGWLAQFHGRALREGGGISGEIAGITGATLTTRAVSRAVRRVLALHGVVRPFDGGSPESDPGGEGGGEGGEDREGARDGARRDPRGGVGGPFGQSRRERGPAGAGAGGGPGTGAPR